MSKQVQENPEQQTTQEPVEETAQETSEEQTEHTEQPNGESAEGSEEAQGDETSETGSTEGESKPDDEQFIIKGKVGDEEITYDLRVPEQRQKLVDDAQKGIGFTKKSQALSEWEKANEPMLNFAQQVLQDETMQKAIVAKQLGIDPSTAFVKTAPPDEYWKEANPQAYWAAYYQHERTANDQARLEQGLKQYKQGLSQNYNTALVEKARVKHDLTDKQANDVAQYVISNMRPNSLEMYSERQFDDAVSALYGREKMKQQAIKQSDNFNKTMKTIAKSTAPAKTVKTVPPKVSKEVEAARSFKEYVKSVSKP